MEQNINAAQDKQQDYENRREKEIGMKLLGKSEAEYDAMTPEEKEKAFDELKPEAKTQAEGNIAAGTSRLDGLTQFFGGVTDSFRNSISIAMGSTDFSSTTVEFKDGKVHVRTCFTAGTLVHTKDGTKVIEDIQIGDEVLSWNEETGEKEYKRVTNIWQRTTNELYEVKLPRQKPIVTTWNHPFWSVTQSAWVETKDLKEGEILSLEDGSEVAIESILHYDNEETTVYNFEVEDNHTYYVSELGVLVHNQSTLCLPPVTGAGMSLDPNTGIGSLVSSASDFIRENPTLDTILDKFGIATSIHAFGDAHKDLVKFETLSALKNVAIGVASIPMVRKGSGAGMPPVLRVDKPSKKANQRIVNPNKQDSPIWKNISDKTKNSDIRQSGKGKDKRYFQWDHTHNDIEVYDRNKKHLGSMNPLTGEIYKPPVTGRKLEIK